MQNNYPLLTSFIGEVSIHGIASNKPLVLEIQSLLKLGGFYREKADGIFGEKSFKAFKQFKAHAYLDKPDVLGKTTAESLLEIVDLGVHPTPQDRPVSLDTTLFVLPGGEPVRSDELIKGSEHFTWGEATKNGTRIPKDRTVVANIIKAAAILDEIREFLGGREIMINSWYRDPATNRAVGGVSNSTHLAGHGRDIVVAGIPPLDVYRLLDPWFGNRGGLGRSPHFTHIDDRNYRARWEYGR